MWKAVARLADTVEHMVRVTMYGPTRRTPLLRSRSAACTWLSQDPPPEPAISPKRGLTMPSAVSPASASASSIAICAKAAASPWKRRCLRSMRASRSMSGGPPTWLRKPSSLYSGMNLIPERSSRSEVVTLARSLPRQETMPRPVMTTRFMSRSSHAVGGSEQPHAQVGRGVDLAAVDQHAGIGDGEHELALDHPLHLDFVLDQLGGRHHLAGELDLADAQRAAAAGIALPHQEEADQLPHGV